MSEKKALVVGAGLVGTTWAILLAKRGYQVDVYERRGDIRKAEIIGGRSINLAMSNRGWKAVERVGIKEQISPQAIPMKGRMMHGVDNSQTFQAYGKEGQAIYSVSRGGLNLELIRKADKYEQVHFHFDEKCKSYHPRSGEIAFQHNHTGVISKLQPQLIFGADGAFSAIRYGLQKTPRFNYSQHYLDYGYKELHIPPTADGDFAMDPNSLHIWPRGRFMLIALPNADRSFTCTLFLAYEGQPSFDQLQTNEQVQAFFETYFPDTLPVMPALLEDFKQNPTASLVTVRCKPWVYNNQVLLMGDASHAIVPFYGQGMNSGLEDCTLLDDLVEEHGEDWPTILQTFNQHRIDDADAIADLALRNFIEMRDLVGDPRFLLRKKIEAHLHQKYPGDFLPVYSMVTFSHIPYDEALQESYAQDQLMERILDIENIESNWQENDEVDRLFKTWLEKKMGEKARAALSD
ncbi:MAG: NAD(P)/FAD-dependent oxidoreductase [Bacteroidota bacterium]